MRHSLVRRVAVAGLNASCTWRAPGLNVWVGGKSRHPRFSCVAYGTIQEWARAGRRGDPALVWPHGHTRGRVVGAAAR